MVHWLFGSPASVIWSAGNRENGAQHRGVNFYENMFSSSCSSWRKHDSPVERPAVLRGPQSCLSLVSWDAGKWTVFLWLWKSPRLSRSNIYKGKSSINGSFLLLGWFLGAHQVVSPHDRLTSALGIKIWIKNKVPIEPRFFLTKLLDSA